MSSNKREQLERAYRATTYEVELPWETVPVRIDGRYPEIDAYVRTAASRTWTVITAFNPRSQPCTREENGRRLIELARRVHTGGRHVRNAEGVPDDDTWLPELSYFVTGLQRNEALALAAEFEQYAIVFGEIGGPAELLWTGLDAETDSTTDAP